MDHRFDPVIVSKGHAAPNIIIKFFFFFTLVENIQFQYFSSLEELGGLIKDVNTRE